MNKQEQHDMVLEMTHPSGAEGWYCPTCGRRTLITWEPKFKKIVLEAGDDDAIHSGGKAGLPTGSLQIEAADTPSPREGTQPSNEDPTLIPWLAWLEKVDFENLWNDED